MPEPKDVAESTNFMGFTHKDCEFFPCHVGVTDPEDNFNCLYCYCPLIFIQCPGPYSVYADKHGQKRKDCSACKIVHDGHRKSWKIIQHWLEHPRRWMDEEPEPFRLKAAMPVEHPRKQS